MFYVKMNVIAKGKNGNYPVVATHGEYCNGYLIEESEQDGVGGIHLLIRDGNGDKYVLGDGWFPKWQIVIYIMNDKGRTIDSFEWNGCRPPEGTSDPSIVQLHKDARRILRLGETEPFSLENLRDYIDRLDADYSKMAKTPTSNE